jgi:hypothetical protein
LCQWIAFNAPVSDTQTAMVSGAGNFSDLRGQGNKDKGMRESRLVGLVCLPFCPVPKGQS